MVSLFINVGRRNRVNPGDIVGAICNEGNVPGKAIGAIDVNDRYTLVDIPAEFVQQVLTQYEGQPHPQREFEYSSGFDNRIGDGEKFRRQKIIRRQRFVPRKQFVPRPIAVEKTRKTTQTRRF